MKKQLHKQFDKIGSFWTFLDDRNFEYYHREDGPADTTIEQNNYWVRWLLEDENYFTVKYKKIT